MGVPSHDTAALLDRVREMARWERQVKVDAPIEAKRLANEQIREATERKKEAMLAARRAGATLSSIAAQLGVSNLTYVSKLLKDAENERMSNSQFSTTVEGNS